VDIKVPCKVYYPRDGKPPKELTASTQAELEGLLRVGWKIKEEKDK
jgi:hypothetical protein